MAFLDQVNSNFSFLFAKEGFRFVDQEKVVKEMPIGAYYVATNGQMFIHFILDRIDFSLCFSRDLDSAIVDFWDVVKELSKQKKMRSKFDQKNTMKYISEYLKELLPDVSKLKLDDIPLK